MSDTATAKALAAFYQEDVTWVHHWNETLFSFRCTRDPALRFVAGQFAMIGLMVEGRPLTRAYSMVSPPWDEGLEFLSIKVQNGPLTSRLQHIQVGEKVLIGRKPVGTLVVENLAPGRNLWMLATGTGLAPFMSLIRDPDTYEKFDRVVVAHTVRQVSELAYRDYITEELPAHELLGEWASEKLVYAPSVTREPFPVQGRITTRIESGAVYAETGLPPLDPTLDRVMMCGSEAFNADTEALVQKLGFTEGTNNQPGTYVLEKAFVTK